MPGRIILLSGHSGVGKSTVCRRVVEAALQRGYRCAGLLTEHITGGEGQRIGVNVIDVATGRKRELARTDRSLSNLQVGHWSFDLSALEWGNAILRGLGECDLLVIDEIGWLEIERGTGWVDAWGALERRRFALAVVIVRPALVEQMCKLVAVRQVLTVTRVTRDSLPDQILQVLDLLIGPFRARNLENSPPR